MIVVALMAFIGFSSPVLAQEEVSAEVSADVVSNYLWRGQKLAEVSVQPSLGVSYKGVSLSAWGNYGISNPDDTKEFDLTLSYSTGGFNIGVTDYFFSGQDDATKYFQYEAHKTAHVFEANVGYDFGPAAIQWFTNFAGDDGMNKDGKRAYSSYVELSAPFTLASLDWSASIGAVPFATSFYHDATGFAVTNVSLKASKDIKVSGSFSIPVFAQLTANPSSQKAYFAFGFTLKP